ncbi:hypothetical protein RRG08_000529 [Elysia crispata]|uniref:Uncharacterized protein n=1 Tax=Elysia crispata TaxID=231223 RepID=A0AAE0XZH7_9GAST|nr:hypothetical protein RRG08_000529 [Elysia crispata]
MPSLFGGYPFPETPARWLGQNVPNKREPHPKKDLLYDELASGSRPTGRPAMRFKDGGTWRSNSGRSSLRGLTIVSETGGEPSTLWMDGSIMIHTGQAVSHAVIPHSRTNLLGGRFSSHSLWK